MKTKKIQQIRNQPEKQQPDCEDERVWQETILGVKKLLPPRLNLEKPRPKYFVIRENVNVFEAYSGDSLEHLIPGRTDNIDANTAKRFKRGEFRIEAVLDLHGFTADTAYDKVEGFIKNAYRRGWRCVQIVTGKGLHRDEDIFAARGVLKDLVPQWLNQVYLRPLILAFDYSRPEDGGDGALTVLLRRKRKENETK